MKFLDVFAGCTPIGRTTTRHDAIKQRAFLLNSMNNLVRELNDEEYYYSCWIDLVPDEAEFEDFINIAERDEDFAEVVERFLSIMAHVKNEEDN